MCDELSRYKNIYISSFQVNNFLTLSATFLCNISTVSYALIIYVLLVSYVEFKYDIIISALYIS